MMRRAALVLSVLLITSSCRDTVLPPPPGPGTVSGRVVRSVPGWSQPVSAEGATIDVMGDSLRVTAGEEGRFAIDGLVRTDTRLWLRHDADGDGVVDGQRILSLASLGVGPGRHVSLGDVVLGKNARIEGSVRISSRMSSDTGHVGTSVVIKGTAFSAFSADNGNFALDALPAGELEVIFFRAGFAPVVVPVELTSGQRLELHLVLLDPSSDSRPADAKGLVEGENGPLALARVKVVGADQLTEVASGTDGAWLATGLTPGVYNLGFEAQGYASLVLPGVVLLPGLNQLSTVRLHAGVSTPVVVSPPSKAPDAGAELDGGPDSGLDGGDAGAFDGGDAGELDGGDAGALDGGDAGALDGGDAGALDGSSDAGPFDGGNDAGVDAGLDCAGACSAGFACSTRISCETDACALVSCNGACRDGRCFANHCAGVTCAPGEVCANNVCTTLACAGRTCPASSQCANGRCVSNLCTLGPCPAGQVCSNGTCLDARCVDVDCGAGRVCVAGQCLPAGGAQGCAPGAVFIGGRCVDLSCQGVTCAPGSFCQQGTCTASGLFAAGLLYPNARTDLTPSGAIFASSPSGWHRINVTALPRVLQLLISRDGQWLFALTDDFEGGDLSGSVWRSTDGITWLHSWSGDIATAGAANAIAVDHVTGSLYVALIANSGTSVIVSRDDGATWQTSFIPPDFAGIRDRINGVAPGVALIGSSNFGNSGVYLYDAGIKVPYFSPVATYLLSDPAGWGPMYVSDTQLRSIDAGILAPISASGAGAVLYDEAPSHRVHLASSAGIWFSNDGVSSWGQRSLPNGTLRLTGLARASDGVLYATNAGASGGAPLLQSFDDGVTWNPVDEAWRRTPELVDPVEQWRPDAFYSWPMRIQPSQPNGWYYEKAGAPQQLTVEPIWSTDGAVVYEPTNGGFAWVPLGRLDSRLTAIVSRACSVGQQRCGTACVNLATDSQNCGQCGVTCATSCQLGRCVGPSDAGSATGCADGTREGFLDEATWLNVAACAGSWTGALTSPGADLLCGSGFHVCDPADLELRVVTVQDALAFPGCFAYRASNDGFDGCEPLVCSNDAAHDDMAGVGRSCLPLNGVTHLGDGGASSCLAGGARLDATCCAASVNGAGCQQTTQSGVVCCRN